MNLIRKRKTIPNFLLKLYQLLKLQTYSKYISWRSDGTCFQIKNKKQFESKILPKLFKHSNFSSFIRQLNLYNFKKNKLSSVGCFFSHASLTRANLNCIFNIKRKQKHNPQLLSQGSRKSVKKLLKSLGMNLNNQLANIKNQLGVEEKQPNEYQNEEKADSSAGGTLNELQKNMSYQMRTKDFFVVNCGKDISTFITVNFQEFAPLAQ